MRQGKIVHWKDDRGFGFILDEKSGSEVFVHISEFWNKQRRPITGELVSYKLSKNPKGRPQAQAVRYINDKSEPRPAKQGAFGPILAISFLLFVGVMVAQNKLPQELLWVLFISNVFAFIAYAKDKSAAKRNKWRIQENTLHLFSLLGGWPAALVAQRVFRHKTSKISFQVTYWITIWLNYGMIVWFLSPDGGALLRQLVSFYNFGIRP